MTSKTSFGEGLQLTDLDYLSQNVSISGLNLHISASDLRDKEEIYKIVVLTDTVDLKPTPAALQANCIACADLPR